MKTYAFGVDIGGTTIKMGLFRTSGDLLETWEIPTRTEAEGAHILEDIAQAVEDKLTEKGISRLDVEGIGMGVPGPIGPDGTVFRCVNLGWGVFNVEQSLGQLTGLKVRAGNDANVAALGEMWQGGGKGYRDLVMISPARPGSKTRSPRVPRCCIPPAACLPPFSRPRPCAGGPCRASRSVVPPRPPPCPPARAAPGSAAAAWGQGQPARLMGTGIWGGYCC